MNRVVSRFGDSRGDVIAWGMARMIALLAFTVLGVDLAEGTSERWAASPGAGRVNRAAVCTTHTKGPPGCLCAFLHTR